MPVEVNGNFVSARFDRAWLFVKALNFAGDKFVPQDTYEICGEIIVTPSLVYARGHFGENGGYEPVITVAFPIEHVYLIQDKSVDECEIHDEIEAEMKDLAEATANAEKSPQN